MKPIQDYAVIGIMENNSIKLTISPLGFPWKTNDPFLFCVHHRDEYPEGNKNMEPNASLQGRNIGQDFTIKDGWRMYHGTKVPGFPYHPHRGFETITVAETGVIDHSDSIGGAGRFSSGDVQWMTAGKGILHSEMFPMIHEDKDNLLEMFQIWLNLPAKDKLVDPHFKMLWNEDIPVLQETDNTGKKTQIKVIAGEVNNTKAPTPTPNSWAAKPENDVAVILLTLEAGASYSLQSANSDSNRSLYFYQGKALAINDQVIPPYHAVEVNASDELILTAGNTEVKVLVLQGKPINEPVAQHGPFVMNTQEEIQQAFHDYRTTHFGGWPWPHEEQVHEKSRGRFALHADGREEIK